MKGYGVYYKENLIAWFAEEAGADCYVMTNVGYTKPTEIGVMHTLGGTLVTPEEHSIANFKRRGAELKPKQELKMGGCGNYCNGCDYSDPVGNCILENLSTQAIEDMASEEPKGDGCNLCNNDGYCLLDLKVCEDEDADKCVKSQEFCAKIEAEDKPCDLCNSDGYCLIDVEVCENGYASCAKNIAFKAGRASEVNKISEPGHTNTIEDEGAEE